jgi:hypothetical protein
MKNEITETGLIFASFPLPQTSPAKVWVIATKIYVLSTKGVWEIIEIIRRYDNYDDMTGIGLDTKAIGVEAIKRYIGEIIEKGEVVICEEHEMRTIKFHAVAYKPIEFKKVRMAK